MADASKLRRGSIVWVVALDPAGRNPKKRACVVIGSTASITPGGSLAAVGVTTTFREPTGPEMIRMRWNVKGSTETGFRKKCFAKVDWGVEIRLIAGDEFDVEFDGDFDGHHVREKELQLIIEAIAKFKSS